jgi:hypothetical protein
MTKPRPEFLYSIPHDQDRPTWSDVKAILDRLGYSLRVEKRRVDGLIVTVRVFPIDHKTYRDDGNTE